MQITIFEYVNPEDYRARFEVTIYRKDGTQVVEWTDYLCDVIGIVQAAYEIPALTDE